MAFQASQQTEGHAWHGRFGYANGYAGIWMLARSKALAVGMGYGFSFSAYVARFCAENYMETKPKPPRRRSEPPTHKGMFKTSVSLPLGLYKASQKRWDRALTAPRIPLYSSFSAYLQALIDDDLQQAENAHKIVRLLRAKTVGEIADKFGLDIPQG
jgi:hypothetical protein